LRSNTKSYGSKADYTDSQNSDITASSGRELYHLQFSFHVASPETFGTPSYTVFREVFSYLFYLAYSHTAVPFNDVSDTISEGNGSLG